MFREADEAFDSYKGAWHTVQRRKLAEARRLAGEHLQAARAERAWTWGGLHDAEEWLRPWEYLETAMLTLKGDKYWGREHRERLFEKQRNQRRIQPVPPKNTPNKPPSGGGGGGNFAI